MPHSSSVKSQTASFLPTALFIFNLLLVGLCFAPSLPALWDAWQTEEYSHGLLIPFLAVLIGWHRLVERKPVMSSSAVGLAVQLLGFLSLGISRLSAFEPFSHYGLILVLVGLAWTYLGRAAVAALVPAFVCLVFAIPLPRLIH
ncbi:MAG: archaeosortase/exosortase family protein, partial [Bdellovibrionales bacterium]